MIMSVHSIFGFSSRLYSIIKNCWYCCKVFFLMHFCLSSLSYHKHRIIYTYGLRNLIIYIKLHLSAGVGAGAGTDGIGGGFNFGLPGTGLGVNANVGFTPSYSPGYAHYYNQHYTPTTYYTYSPPAAYYPTTTNTGAHQTAAPYLARAVPHFYRQPIQVLF